MPRARRARDPETIRPSGEWGAWTSHRNSESDEELEYEGNSRKAKAKAQSKNKNKDKVQFFALRNELGRRKDYEKVQMERIAPKELHNLFGMAIDEDIIEMVYEETGHSLALATEQLLSMTVTTQASPEGQSRPSSSTAAVQEQVPAEDRHSLWSFLPEECKQDILSRLSTKEAARSSCISWEFARAVRQNRSRCTSLTLSPKIPPHSLGPMLGGYPNLATLSFRRLSSLRDSTFYSIFQSLSTRCQSLTCLDLKGCKNLTNEHVSQFRKSLRKLQEVNISNCPEITDQGLGFLATYSREGEEGSLKVRDFEAEGVEALRLRMLSVRKEVDPEALEVLETEEGTSPDYRSSGLRALSLAGCIKLTNQGVASLFGGETSRHSLQTLDISRCPELTSSALQKVQFSALRELTAGGLANLTRLTLLLPREHQLKELTLNNNPALSHLKLHVPSLEILRFPDCSFLRDVELNCPKLTSLSSARCTQLEGNLVASCPSLRVLDLDRTANLEQEALDELVGGCLALEELCCNGLKQVHSFNLQEHTALKKLSADGCPMLRRVNIRSNLLKELSARNCANLREVRCSSAALRRLFLTNCPKLTLLVSQQISGWIDLDNLFILTILRALQEVPWTRLEESRSDDLQKASEQRKKVTRASTASGLQDAQDAVLQIELGLQNKLALDVQQRVARLLIRSRQ